MGAPLPRMRNYWIDTSLGRVAFTAETPDPAVLLVHGFRRELRHVIDWRDRIPGLGFLNLPGHSGFPELAEVSVQAWVAAWREALGVMSERPFLLAESMGAVLSMCLPARAVVAVEPLLSVDDLWPQHETIARARARGIDIGAAYEALFNEPYDWVLERISAPTLVIAGDMPLLPRRPLPFAPSLLTDADFAHYAAHPLVEAHRIPGGHTLFDQNPQGVMALTLPFFEKHGWRGAQSA